LADGTTQGEALERIKAALDPVAFPAGYRWSQGSGFDEEDEAGKQMGINTLLALVMIYVVMAALFESLLFPAAILTTIVFSVFGGLCFSTASRRLALRTIYAILGDWRNGTSRLVRDAWAKASGRAATTAPIEAS